MLRLGATPDLLALSPTHGLGTIQIKSVSPWAFKNRWNNGGDVTPPDWIEAQVLTEAHLVGAQWAAVAALVIEDGIDLHLVDVPIDTDKIAAIRDRVALFWRAVETGRPPDPDYGRDGRLLAKLYAQDDGTEVDLSGDNEFARNHRSSCRRARCKEIQRSRDRALHNLFPRQAQDRIDRAL